MKRQLLSTIIFLLSLLAPCVVDVQMNTFSVEACVVSEAERESGRLIKKIKVESVEEKREVDSKEEDPIKQSKFRTHIFYAREAGGIPNIRWLS